MLHSEFPLKALAHDFVFKIPFIAYLARRVGDGWESCRPSKDRDRIDFKHRSGFVRLARETQVPIVPIVAAGAHDGWFVLFRGNRIAKALGLYQLFRIEVFPIALAFPFGIAIGPFFPFFPLPRKIILEVLPPIQITENESAAAEKIVAAMQSKLDKLVRELPRKN